MKAGAIGFKTKVIVGDAATLYLAEKIAKQFGGGIPDAPIDGVLYGRKNGDWVEIVAEEQIQSNLTETNVESKAFVIGKEQFKADILGDVVIPDPQFYFTENRQNLVFKNGWIKIPLNFNINQYNIKNITLNAIFSTGKKQLNCEVSYPSRDTYSSAVDWAFYVKDVDNILNENSDFSSIEFKFDLELDYVSRFNGHKYNLGNGVVFDEVSEYHSTAGVITFDKVYPTFSGLKYETVLDPLTNYASLDYNYTQTYCEIKKASIVSKPYLNGAISENIASNPNVLTVASHYGNTFERRDITSGAGVFLQNVISVGARRNSTTDHTGASSYGYGVEFFEMAGKQEMNDNYNGAGDIWFPSESGYNVYQQSPTCAIVSAKFRQIQDATKASWSICREAARATASNNGVWDMYRGFGIINVELAIQYIEDNYINNAEYRANLADKISGENKKYSYIKYSDLDENCPLPKRESDLEYAKSTHDHSGQVINPDAVTIAGEYTDLQAVDLAIGTIFKNIDQNCYMQKIAADVYHNFGSELPSLSKIGDNTNHLNGMPVYITSGAGNLNVVSLASSVIGKADAMATQDILNTGDKTGYYCYFGNVHKFPRANIIKSTDNTANWIEGAELHLCNEPGKLSTEVESAPAKCPVVARITAVNGSNITLHFIPNKGINTTDLSDWDGSTNAFADAEKLFIRKANGVVQEITKSDFYAVLDDYFAKLSGGNDFLNTQNFDGGINHKAGEYFYTAASKTADTVNDTRVINSAGVEIHSICTVANSAKGGGTWVEIYRLDKNGITSTKFFNLICSSYIVLQSSSSYVYLYTSNGVIITTSEGEAVRFLKNRDINFLIGKYQYSAASPTSDTINDRRTSNVSGVKIEEICTVASGTKGGGTWIILSTTDATGKMQFLNTGRRKWWKHTAQTITFTTGSTADNVSTLQTGMDGNYMTIVEASGAPGIDAYVEFTSVQAFERVRLLAAYVGTTSHQVLIQVYDWVGSTWRTFDTMETNAFDTTNLQFQNHEFTVYDDTNYIGTSANLGKVRVRFYHPVTGNATHRFYIDELSLRQ